MAISYRYHDMNNMKVMLPFCHLQGDDAVHDAIRQRELEVGVPKRVKFALTAFGSINDDVLWAALFVLAVLVRDSSTLHQKTTQAIAASHIVEVLKLTVHAYTARQDEYSQVGVCEGYGVSSTCSRI
jgi:hypothetical protein